MLSQIHYLIRSPLDGKYLTAYPNTEEQQKGGYLLLFQEHHNALSYLNSHAGDLANQLTVESITPNQLKGVLQRWGFIGVGIVEDALLPRIRFLSLD